MRYDYLLFFIKLLLNAINAQIGMDHEVHEVENTDKI